MMASGVPEIVTARSVELGSMSPATWTWAPVDWSRERDFEGLDNVDKIQLCVTQAVQLSEGVLHALAAVGPAH